MKSRSHLVRGFTCIIEQMTTTACRLAKISNQNIQLDAKTSHYYYRMDGSTPIELYDCLQGCFHMIVDSKCILFDTLEYLDETGGLREEGGVSSINVKYGASGNSPGDRLLQFTWHGRILFSQDVIKWQADISYDIIGRSLDGLFGVRYERIPQFLCCIFV